MSAGPSDLNFHQLDDNFHYSFNKFHSNAYVARCEMIQYSFVNAFFKAQFCEIEIFLQDHYSIWNIPFSLYSTDIIKIPLGLGK